MDIIKFSVSVMAVGAFFISIYSVGQVSKLESAANAHLEQLHRDLVLLHKQFMKQSEVSYNDRLELYNRIKRLENKTNEKTIPFIVRNKG